MELGALRRLVAGAALAVAAILVVHVVTCRVEQSRKVAMPGHARHATGDHLPNVVVDPAPVVALLLLLLAGAAALAKGLHRYTPMSGVFARDPALGRGPPPALSARLVSSTSLCVFRC